MPRRVMRVQLHRRMAAQENELLKAAWANKPQGPSQATTPSRSAQRLDDEKLPRTERRSEDGGRTWCF